MGWLDKLFGREEPSTAEEIAPATDTVASIPAAPLAILPGIRFGRYSDNNKSYDKIRSWYLAEDRFKEKAYAESFAAFFDHISDGEEQNVVFRTDGNAFSFEFFQGSEKILGQSDGKHIVAKASVALMEKPSNAVMHRLLTLNFSLRYTRFALDDTHTLCQLFDTPVSMASPNKLYYGLRELAKYADRLDDQLITDFASLKPTGTGHIQPLPEAELRVKYTYFRKWIEDTLGRVSGLNADSFAGAIAYLLLTLLYRIDFLIVPEAGLLSRLETLSNVYWHKKDEIPLVERNARMMEGIRKLLDITYEEFAKGAYRTKNTFAVVAAPPPDKVRENIQSANKDAQWYVENKYPDLVLIINEYGMVYNQFSYSMPALLTGLTIIYMAVMHADFFRDLGMNELFYDPATGQLYQERITRAIDEAIARWPDKYPALHWDHNKISYSNLPEFAFSFSEHLATLNLEIKK